MARKRNDPGRWDRAGVGIMIGAGGLRGQHDGVVMFITANRIPSQVNS